MIQINVHDDCSFVRSDTFDVQFINSAIEEWIIILLQRGYNVEVLKVEPLTNFDGDIIKSDSDGFAGIKGV